MLTDAEVVKNRWAEYTKVLYADPNAIAVRNQASFETCEKEPEILCSEVKWAVKKLSDGKSSGLDGLPAELIKAGGYAAIDLFVVLCNKILFSGTWPHEWKQSVFIPLFKKGDAMNCKNYRTIALVTHARSSHHQLQVG